MGMLAEHQANMLTLAENGGCSFIPLNPIFLSGRNVMCICIRRTSEYDIGIRAKNTLGDEFCTDSLTKARTSFTQNYSLSRDIPDPAASHCSQFPYTE